MIPLQAWLHPLRIRIRRMKMLLKTLYWKICSNIYRAKRIHRCRRSNKVIPFEWEAANKGLNELLPRELQTIYLGRIHTSVNTKHKASSLWKTSPGRRPGGI